MENIEVSVLCMTFNQKRYIRKALDGLVMQRTDFAYEIIVHDDCSTDGTKEIVAEYAARYPDKIVAILQEENQYSQGIDIFGRHIIPIMRGTYLTICEGDDYWTDPEKLQLQRDAMAAHPECSMITHKVQGISEDEKELIRTFPDTPTREGVITDQEAIHRAFHGVEWMFHTTSYFVRKQMILDAYKNQIGFFVRPMYGDQAVFQLAAANGHFYYIDRVMSCYRMGAVGSLVTKDKQTAMRKHRAERGIAALKDFDTYTKGRFHDDVIFIMRRYEFVLLEINKEFKKMLLPEYKAYYEFLPASARIHVNISAVFPFFDPLYYKIRKLIKKY